MAKLFGMLKNYKFAILIVLFAFLGGFILFTINHKGSEKNEPPTPKIQFVRENKVSVYATSYEPKKRLADGSLEKTDVDIKMTQPKVRVKINGKEHAFKLEEKESQKFEKGKVVLTQTQTVNFDIKTPVYNELIIYSRTDLNKDKQLDTVIGVEKKNGNFRYGGEYSLIQHDYNLYLRYDIIKLYSK